MSDVYEPVLAVQPQKLRAEQIRLLYDQAGWSMIATVVNSIILSLILWPVVPHASLITWLVLSLLIITLRYLLVEFYRLKGSAAANPQTWLNLFLIGLFVSGTVLGSTGIWLFPSTSFAHQVFLTFLLGGMVAGAAGSYAVMLEAFCAFSIPTVTPILLRFFWNSNQWDLVMGGMLLLFSAIMLMTAYHGHKTVLNALRLHIENGGLVSHLTLAKERAEHAVAALTQQIAERDQVKEALHESEQQFQMLVETMNEGLGVRDENDRITYVNDKLCTMLGYSKQELIGRPASDLLSGTASMAYSERQSQQQLRKRTSIDTELVSKNGRKIPVIVSATPVYDDNGQFRGVITAITDITILKRAQQRLKESEAKYRLIFENSPLGIVHFDHTGTVTAYNDNLLKMSGIARNRFIGINVFDYLQNESMRAAISTCLAGRPGHYEGHYRWVHNGKTTPMKADYGPILAEDGSIVGGIGIIEDISQRKQAEDQLRDQLHFLQTLIDTIPNPIFYKDTHGRYLGCNKAFENRLGLPKAAIIGQTVYDLLPAELAEVYDKIDRTLFRDLGQQVYESSLLYADGKQHEVIVNKATFTNAQGKLAGLVGVTVDITERKQAEEALRTAHDQLEKRVTERTAELAQANAELRIEVVERKRAEAALRSSSEKLKLFAYSVVHDLKSPTIAIYGLTKRLERLYQQQLDERGRDYCKQVRKASEHVVALVEKINVYAASAEAPLTIEKVQIGEILTMVKDEFSPRFSIRQVRWSVPEVLPEIMADRLAMLRIFRNLVDNAFKYGGEQLSEVQIAYEENTAFHVFSVTDDGVGLGREDSARLFGLFQRNDTSHSIEGSGLGLAIVKEIVERHRGKVWVKTGSEKGTTFYISIAKDLPDPADESCRPA